MFGIPQDGLTQKERQVPLDEPPPLKQNSELTYIGKPTPRYDGPAKAMGSGKYTADIQLPGMLYARMVDATVPHGRITSIDTSAAEKLPGVKAVHVIEHTYGIAELRDPSQEAPSKYPIVRYAGQPIAGVAAISPQIASDAAALIKVTYDTMPFVVDKQAARAVRRADGLPWSGRCGGKRWWWRWSKRRAPGWQCAWPATEEGWGYREGLRRC